MRASSSSAEAPNLLALAPPASFATSSTQVVLGRRSATEKLAGFIIDMIEGRDADDIAALPMQRNEIADYLGLTFETVSRALRVLKGGRRYPRSLGFPDRGSEPVGPTDLFIPGTRKLTGGSLATCQIGQPAIRAATSLSVYGGRGADGPTRSSTRSTQ